MGAVPVQEAKWCPVGEAADLAGLDEQHRGAGGVDAVRVQQAGAGLAQGGGQGLIGVLGAGVDLLQVGHELDGQGLAGLARGVLRADGGEDLAGLPGGEVDLGSAGDELQQQAVDLGDLARVLLTEHAASVDQDPEQVELGVADDRPQAGGANPDDRDGVGVGLSVLRPLPEVTSRTRCDRRAGTSTTRPPSLMRRVAM
ncbi:hypothetical protein [Serinicoccus sediminis]|uniref:hypothetical protein n=1 Tax=Serinicoccus sediminis TaxID=2306021 RepID=UPI001EE10D7B|nr:hypothetical protein [Serinicoccus sediminis]